MGQHQASTSPKGVKIWNSTLFNNQAFLETLIKIFCYKRSFKHQKWAIPFWKLYQFIQFLELLKTPMRGRLLDEYCINSNTKLYPSKYKGLKKNTRKLHQVFYMIVTKTSEKFIQISTSRFSSQQLLASSMIHCGFLILPPLYSKLLCKHRLNNFLSSLCCIIH